MKIEYLHASKFGNGAMVAEEFKQQMATREVAVDVHHIRKITPKAPPSADLYVLSSPGPANGRPIRGMRRFLKDVTLPAGTGTHSSRPRWRRGDKKTGRMPTEERDLQVPACAPDHERGASAQGAGKGGGRQDCVTVQRATGRGMAEEGHRLRNPDFQDLAGRKPGVVISRSTQPSEVASG